MPTVTESTPKKRRRRVSSPEETPPASDIDYDNLPFNLVIHGLSGIGKTSFAANAPRPHFLIDRQERGVNKLKKRNLVDRKIPVNEMRDWNETLDTIRGLTSESAPFKTLIMDSLTGFEKLCFQHMCHENYNDDWNNEKHGFYAYSKGPKQSAKREWPELLDLLTDLADVGKNVILIGHSQPKIFNNPEGPDYSRWIPYLDPETWAITYRWTEYTVFAGYHIIVKQEGLRHKAQEDSGERFLNLEWSPAYDAKCLSDCSPSVSMGSNGKESWNNFWKEVNK